MYRVNLLLYMRGENGWKFQPVRKTPHGKFVWDRSETGAYYLEWYEDGKRRRKPAGIRPADVLEARRRKILELKGKATEQGRTVSPGAGDEETPVPLAHPQGAVFAFLIARGRSCINKPLRSNSFPNRNGGRDEAQAEERRKETRSDPQTQRSSQEGRGNAQTPGGRSQSRSDP